MADQAVFESFFQQADADRDGKVSGSEAIHFFKGANLPQPVLAKIWHAADDGHTGFLSKAEFYNALKLVTVAQSGRELTPEIMRAALVGPASLRIPAPKIQTPAAAPSPQQQPVPSAQPGNIQQPARPPLQAPAPAPVAVNLQQQQAPRPFTSQASAPQAPLQPPLQQTPRPSPQQPQAPPRPSFSAFPQVYQQPPSQLLQQQQQRPPTPGIQGQLFSSSTPPRGAPQSPGFAPQQDGFTPRSPVPPTFTATGSKPSAGFDSPFGSNAFSASSAPNTAAAPPPPSPIPVRQQAPQQMMTPQGGAPRGPQGFRPPVPGPAWPKMTTLDVQRYSQLFTSVDDDKDGKITGAQARHLFSSWGLPREVLKQIWDLSDQDGDSMLSFREFSTALYLMERFREGRPLPPVLPAGFHYDERYAPQAPPPPPQQYNMPAAAWQRNQRMMQPMPPGQFTQDPAHRNPRNRGRAPAPEAEQVMMPGGNKILDSREKLEFYRNKLQDIVLFKKKCDNRLAEITDKASSEKREEELMAKKYEEKYKQALEVNSHLVSDEASFREMQTLKTELRNAIVEIERGGNPNTLLQTRADRISRDLDELEKALLQRGQLLGFQVAGSTPVELPFGWQPGLQQNSIEWDENWDKFDDEGYTTTQGLMDDEPGVAPAPRTTSSIPGWDDGSLFGEDLDFTTPATTMAQGNEEAADSPRAESETSSLKSGVDSPQWSPMAKRGPPGSSPLSVAADHSSELHEDTPSEFQVPPLSSVSSFEQAPAFDGDQFDKPWASAFSTPGDDIWGLQSDSPSPSIRPVRTRTERDSIDIGENDFFNSKDWASHSGVHESNSVPSTPLFTSNSPGAGKQNSFFEPDSRRDSFASSHGRASNAFDESDPFGDTGPFSRKSDRWSTF